MRYWNQLLSINEIQAWVSPKPCCVYCSWFFLELTNSNFRYMLCNNVEATRGGFSVLFFCSWKTHNPLFYQGSLAIFYYFDKKLSTNKYLPNLIFFLLHCMCSSSFGIKFITSWNMLLQSFVFLGSPLSCFDPLSSFDHPLKLILHLVWRKYSIQTLDNLSCLMHALTWQRWIVMHRLSCKLLYLH